MSRILLRFAISLFTFVLGIALVSIPTRQCRPTSEANPTIATSNATTPSPVIPEMSDEDRREMYGYGADGVTCSVSFDSASWVPRKSVILKIQLQNTTDKDIVIPAVFAVELNKKGLGKEEDIRYGEAVRSWTFLNIQNGRPVSVFSNHGTGNSYNESAPKSFRLRAGEMIQLQTDISDFGWNDNRSSILADKHFSDIVPVGEYVFFARIRSDKWTIVSNRAPVRIEQ